MLTRLLHNLKGAYLRAGDDANALAAVERILILEPQDLDQVRDRGLLLFRMRQYNRALDSLQRYLDGAPGAADREATEQHVRTLRQLLSSLN